MDGDDPRIDDDLEYKLHELLGNDADDETVRSLDSYTEKYGCASDVTLGLLSNPTETSQKGFEPVEQVEGDKIYLGMNTIEKTALQNGWYTDEAQKYTNDTIIHAATHACSTQEVMTLSQPVTLIGSNDKVVAVSGFGLFVDVDLSKISDQMEVERLRELETEYGIPMTTIEEGVAEWLAHNLDPTYEITPRYKDIYNLTDFLIPDNITSEEIAAMTQKADGIIDFVKLVASTGENFNFEQELANLAKRYRDVYAMGGENIQAPHDLNYPVIPTPTNPNNIQIPGVPTPPVPVIPMPGSLPGLP